MAKKKTPPAPAPQRRFAATYLLRITLHDAPSGDPEAEAPTVAAVVGIVSDALRASLPAYEAGIGAERTDK